jgi:hypothetical protein
MPIVFGSKLQSEVANLTWIDKTQDDATIGKIALNEPSSDSIADAQLQINKNKKVIFGESVKSNGDQLTPDVASMNQEFRMIGNAAPVTLNTLPFTAQPLDGSVITLVGHSDTFTVEIPFNDAQYGFYGNGDAILKRGYILKLVYNDELERYLEIGRNF